MKDLLDELNPTHRFRDPIYGFIPLTDAEIQIIDTPIFQRLRRVHQLALTKYVYPTAEHSRFVHSLGVLQVSTEMFLSVYKNSPAYFEKKSRKDLVHLLKTLRFSALLHDVGHLPFSHATENCLLPEGIDHEQVGAYLIENYVPIKEILNNEINNHKIVSNILTNQTVPKYFIIKKIISGIFDADRADYLLRDSYICGVKYGEYDYDRYKSSFIIDKDGYLGVRDRDVFVLEAFILARLHYNLQVPFHKTRMGYDLILKQYISQHASTLQPLPVTYNETSITNIDFEEFIDFDDYFFYQHIKQHKNKSEWARMLLREGHISPILDIKAYSQNGDEKALFSALCIALDSTDLTQDKHYFTKEHTEKLTPLDLFEGGEQDIDNKDRLYVFLKDGNKRIPIDFYSNIISSLNSPVRLYRVYGRKENLDQLTIILHDVKETLKLDR